MFWKRKLSSEKGIKKNHSNFFSAIAEEVKCI